MTTTKPLPPHGTYARANGSPGHRPPCHCDLCTPVRRAAKKRYRIGIERGISRIIDAAPARQHLQLLHLTMSWTRIIAATGCAQDTIFNIHAGRQTRISRTTHDKIHAVKPSHDISAGMYLDATGSVRRLQALQAVGHTIRVIANAMDHASEENVRLATRGTRTRIRAGFAAKIAAAYEQLRDQPGDDLVARRALALGYLPPHVWDTDIDDPEADPRAGDSAQSVGHPDKAESLQITEAMTRAGRTAAEIAVHTGRSERTIVRWRVANGWKAAA